jgi:adenine-specific DNA-methyltransferase
VAYALSWSGKEEASTLAGTPPSGVLRALPDERAGESRTKNLIVIGDNLEALKLLGSDGEEAGSPSLGGAALPSFRGRIRMIYIDPPYNTGKDFVYEDDYARPRGAEFSEGDRLHSRWLNMIYPRLILAREMLSEDGALFVSIDDNEIHNIRTVLGELFGEANFIGCFVWLTKREAKGIPTRTMFVKNHEYVLCFAKDYARFAFKGERRTTDGFHNPDADPRGPWKRQYLQRFGQGFPVRRLTNPTDGTVFRFESPYSEEKMALWATEDRLIFPDAADRFPARKEYFNEYRNGNKPITSFLDLFSTKVNTEKVKALFGREKVFQFTKPVELLKKLIRAFVDEDDIIMDFFAGSGTTAQAVLELNREDGGKRSFILVQAPEPVDPRSEAGKAGFRAISDICVERVRRVIGRMEEGNTDTTADRGFVLMRIEAVRENGA